MTLPVYPPPFPTEWLGSWVWRLAQANATDVYGLLRHLGVEAEGTPTGDVLKRLSQATGCDLSVLQAMNTPPDSLLGIGRPSTRPVPLLGVRYLQVCPQCLADDAMPFIRRDWVRRTVAVCSRHGAVLLDTCPHCGVALHLTRPAGSDIRSKVPTVATRTSLGQCWRCSIDLSVAKTEQATFTPKARHPIQITQHSLPQEGIEGFQNAVWDMLTSFYVAEFVSVRQVEVAPLPISRPVSAHTLRVRLATQPLFEWLFYAQDDFPHVLARVRAWAATLLGRLDVNPDSRRRWLYLAWLLHRILDDPPRVLITDFPRFVALLSDHWGKGMDVPQPRVGWEWTDEQWKRIEPLLQKAGAKRVDDRRAFEALTWWLVERHGKVSRHEAYLPIKEHVDYWYRGGVLGIVLGELFHSLMLRRRIGGLARFADGRGEDWEVQTARVLLSDGVVELARQTNRGLHRKLLTELVIWHEGHPPLVQTRKRVPVLPKMT